MCDINVDADASSRNLIIKMHSLEAVGCRWPASFALFYCNVHTITNARRFFFLSFCILNMCALHPHTFCRHSTAFAISTFSTECVALFFRFFIFIPEILSFIEFTFFYVSNAFNLAHSSVHMPFILSYGPSTLCHSTSCDSKWNGEGWLGKRCCGATRAQANAS